ncbi:hypothetical protein K502DRAFT_201934 [Neoconidiobolus thromboides FSU 785]|nr:hypothetical protein K502DRAFT_201934 [Neoconidiobolus thromboides FSU 785]
MSNNNNNKKDKGNKNPNDKLNSGREPNKNNNPNFTKPDDRFIFDLKLHPGGSQGNSHQTVTLTTLKLIVKT